MATSVAVERNPSMIAAAESTKKTSGGSGKDQGGHDGRNNKKKKKRPSVTISLTNCKYDCVRRVAKRFGMRIVNDEDDWTIYWTDMALPERVGDIKSFQKVNHFPGMNEICRKDLLARNMNRMLKLFPREYNCFPQTWTLPADYGDFQSYIQSKKNKVFIAKPGSGCQGKGIFLFKNLKDVKPGEHVVCQQYISKPFTIDKFKFDLRLYVLVTSCDPLRVYCYKDGLVRLATVKYKEPTGGNMDELCMHLTNYAINKHSKDFMRDEECGSKRRITTLNNWFTSNGYDIDKIWSDIDDVIIKTLISAHPVVSHNYRSFFPNHSRGSACFEILGFDILLDRKLKPWLMEVNRSPSFHTDSPLDKEIKEGLIYDTFNLIDLFANDRRRCIEEERQRARDRLLYRQRSKETSVNDKDVKAEYMTHFEKYEETHLGEYRRIYPLNGNEEKYVKFFNQNTSLCVQTIASKARADLAKQMREELELKQKEMEKYLKKEPRMKEGVRGGGDGTESPPRDKKPPAIRRRSYTIRLHNESTKDTCKVRIMTSQRLVMTS
jgi:tubulin polyglutamylase TTLL6/13